MSNEDFMMGTAQDHHDQPLTEPEKLEQAVIDTSTEFGADNLYALAKVAFLLDQCVDLETGPYFTATILGAPKRFRKAKMSKADLEAIQQLGERTPAPMLGTR